MNGDYTDDVFIFPYDPFTKWSTPEPLMPSGAAVDYAQQAQAHLESALSTLTAITLNDWRGSAAQAAQGEQTEISAQIRQAQASAAQAVWAVSAQREAASVRMVCAAATGVY